MEDLLTDWLKAYLVGVRPENLHKLRRAKAIGEGHCKEIARRFRESATKTQELAAMHEEMAKAAAQ